MENKTNNKTLNINQKVKYSGDSATCTIQLKKRRKPWWLLLFLLLLLPLLLLIKCERSLTVYCYDAETKDPIEGVEVTLNYRTHYLYYENSLFVEKRTEKSGSTNEDGLVQFDHIKCSLFCYLFHYRSMANLAAVSYQYDDVDTTVAIHREKRIEIPMNQDESVPVPTSGDVQVLLYWYDYNDLDLACKDPNGDKLYFDRRRVPSGGIFEIDMNAGGTWGEHPSETPIENIYWPRGEAPFGTYSVYVKFYYQHEERKRTSHYKVKVVYGSKTEWYEGDISKADGEVKICTFTLSSRS